MPIVFGAYLGGKRHIDTFGYRQGIDVRAKPNHRSCFTAFQKADNTGMGNTGFHVQAQILQVLCNLFGRLEFSVRELREPMKMTTPFYDLRLNPSR